eukprot:TRINITY_DN3006_c0_g1_i1.p1 TRINITY_DN3006_c0_g1~~TRINITY_DN3006_c0_g1_i1.p1  ORF type:complete len:575 (-),score=37.11 TRINITY_DN3006_c0_g1_i1:1159-2883(-)
MKIANSPSKNVAEARRALKYMLPTIPERGVINKPSGINKKITTPKANNELAKVKPPPESSQNPPENPPRSMSNVRSQDSLNPLMQFFQHNCGVVLTPATDLRGVAQKNTTPRNAGNYCSLSNRKKMKKLKLLIDKATEKVQIRNRSVSIESGNTSPEKAITPLYPTLESGRPTEGSSNERTSEDSRKYIGPSVNTGQKKSSRRSLISPPSMEPQAFHNLVNSKQQLHSRMIKRITKEAVLKKNFSVAHMEDKSMVASLVLPDDANYHKLVKFTENLKQAFVVPSTARASNLRLPPGMVNSVRENVEKFSPVNCNTASTPQSQKESTMEHNKLFTASTNCQTLSASELIQKLKEKGKLTRFAKYIKLNPKASGESNGNEYECEKSLSPTAKGEVANYSEESENEVDSKALKEVAKGNETTRNIPVKFSNELPEKIKGKRVVISKGPGLRIVRKIVKGPADSDAQTPKHGQESGINDRKLSPVNMNEIKGFEDLENISEKGEEKVESENISQIDCSSIRDRLHIQKGEAVSLFPVLKGGDTSTGIRLAIPGVLFMEPSMAGLKQDYSCIISFLSFT